MKKFYKVVCEEGICYFENTESGLRGIKDMVSDLDEDFEITIKAVEMTQEEFDEMPEFDG